MKFTSVIRLILGLFDNEDPAIKALVYNIPTI